MYLKNKTQTRDHEIIKQLYFIFKKQIIIYSSDLWADKQITRNNLTIFRICLIKTFIFIENKIK